MPLLFVRFPSKFSDMKRLIALALFAGAVFAQTVTLTPTGPATTYPGQTVTLTVTMTGSSGQSVAGVQWTAGYPVGFTGGSPTVSSADGILGDSAQCGPLACVVVGSTISMADGPLATIPVTVGNSVAPGNFTIPLTGIIGATGGGLNVPGMTAGPPYSLKVLSTCDLNADGNVNVQDVQIVISAVIGSGTCPASITGGCTLITILQEIIAANGGACKVP